MTGASSAGAPRGKATVVARGGAELVASVEPYLPAVPGLITIPESEGGLTGDGDVHDQENASDGYSPDTHGDVDADGADEDLEDEVETPAVVDDEDDHDSLDTSHEDRPGADGQDEYELAYAAAVSAAGADLDDNEGDPLSMRVVPQKRDEFRCSGCFLILHRSQVTVGTVDVCRDCS